MKTEKDKEAKIIGNGYQITNLYNDHDMRIKERDRGREGCRCFE